MKAVLILGAILLLAIVSTTSHFAGKSAQVEKVAVDQSVKGDQSDEARPDIKLILLALRPEGFETNEMQLTAGEYLFMVSNRTGLDEVNVVLTREGKEHTAAATVRGRRKEWKQRLKLTPGTYLVTVNDNPDWTCQIVVGP